MTNGINLKNEIKSEFKDILGENIDLFEQSIIECDPKAIELAISATASLYENSRQGFINRSDFLEVNDQLLNKAREFKNCRCRC